MIKDYGFVPPEITPDNYVLGSSTLPKVVLREDGDWSDFIPEFEQQHEPDFDTYNCTAFGTTNAVELILRALYNVQTNHSERFVGIKAGTKPPGNNPHVVAEAIRKNGLVPDEILPFDTGLLTTVEEYFSYKGGDELQCEIEGQKWVRQWEFGHEWLWWSQPDAPRRNALIREALKYSPVACSVTAWHEENGVYVDQGRPNTHWCVIIAPTLKGWKVLDSYEPYIKTLSYDHEIGFAKRYHLSPKKPTNWVTDLFTRLWLFLISLVVRGWTSPNTF